MPRPKPSALDPERLHRLWLELTREQDGKAVDDQEWFNDSWEEDPPGYSDSSGSGGASLEKPR